MLVAMASGLAVAGCGDPDPPLPAESSEPPPLTGTAAFQRGSDVYVRTSAAPPAPGRERIVSPMVSRRRVRRRGQRQAHPRGRRRFRQGPGDRPSR
ncbi:MAG: hypothetical protein M5U09_10845 [Gammaproteobacteria bacterium]|nr:hypothetical protein [Gammaproteobacteria bacterium]